MSYSKNIPTLVLLTSLMGVSPVLAMNTESESDNDGPRSTVQVKQSHLLQNTPEDLDEKIEEGLKKEHEVAALGESTETNKTTEEQKHARSKKTEEEKASKFPISARARRDALTKEEYLALSKEERKTLVITAAVEEGKAVYHSNQRIMGPSPKRLLKRLEKKLGIRT